LRKDELMLQAKFDTDFAVYLPTLKIQKPQNIVPPIPEPVS